MTLPINEQRNILIEEIKPGTIQILPNEIVALFFIYCHQPIGQLAKVCKKWNQILQSDTYHSIWQALFQKTFGTIPKKLDEYTYREMYIEAVKNIKSAPYPSQTSKGKTTFASGALFNNEGYQGHIDFNPTKTTLIYNTDQSTFLFNYETDQIVGSFPPIAALGTSIIPRQHDVAVVDVSNNELKIKMDQQPSFNNVKGVKQQEEIRQVFYHESNWLAYLEKSKKIKIYDDTWEEKGEIDVFQETHQQYINYTKTLKTVFLLAYNNKLVTLHQTKHLAIWDLESKTLLRFIQADADLKNVHFVYNERKIVRVTPSSIEIIDLKDETSSFALHNLEVPLSQVKQFYQFLNSDFDLTELSAEAAQNFWFVKKVLGQQGMPVFGNYQLVSTVFNLMRLNKNGQLIDYSFLSKKREPLAAPPVQLNPPQRALPHSGTRKLMMFAQEIARIFWQFIARIRSIPSQLKLTFQQRRVVRLLPTE